MVAATKCSELVAPTIDIYDLLVLEKSEVKVSAGMVFLGALAIFSS